MKRPALCHAALPVIIGGRSRAFCHVVATGLGAIGLSYEVRKDN